MKTILSMFPALLLYLSFLITIQGRIIEDQYGNPINPSPYIKNQDNSNSKNVLDAPHEFTAMGPYGSWRTIPYFDDFFICGAEMRFEDPQGKGTKKDDTATNGFRFKLCQNINWYNQRQIQFSGIWGDWKGMVMCPAGHYVMGFNARIQGWQGTGDDTAFNGLEIMCKNPQNTDSQTLTVFSGVWGSYRGWKTTQNNEFFYKLDVQFEENQKGGDDTALNGLKFYSKSLI